MFRPCSLFRARLNRTLLPMLGAGFLLLSRRRVWRPAMRIEKHITVKGRPVVFHSKTSPTAAVEVKFV